jgi:Family of unknown function (DUF5946)
MSCVQCENCGAVVEDADGPTHAYMVAPPGCWSAFGALQADEMARFGYPPVHGLAVDAYAASHGGDGSERRDRQSVAIHLLALRAVLEEGESSERRIALLRRLADQKADWPKLDRPGGVPALNLTHARDASGLDDYTGRVREWASAVWAFWTPQHPQVAAWAARFARR